VPLILPLEDRCSFCAYLGGERPYTILGIGSLTALLVTFEQRGVGHLLAIPIAHRPTLFDVTDAEAAGLMLTTIRAAEAIRAAFDPEGIAVWQNNGVPANQSIPHVHFHIAGTLPGGGTNWGAVERLPTSVTDRIASELRPHLAPIP
jgi:histidine triad (HIT) family protein